MNVIKLLALVAVALSFNSCNTIIGVGRDIKQVGNTLGGGLENKGHGQTWSGDTPKPATNTPAR